MAFALAAVGSTLIAAIIGTFCLLLGGVISDGSLRTVALSWWQGDLMGDLLIGPLLLVYFNPRAFVILKGRLLEGGLLLSLTFAASIGIFASRHPGFFQRPYFVFLLMVWSAVRFTEIGAVTCVMIVSAVGLRATLNNLGPYAAAGTDAADVLELQLFICVLSATSLVMAMAMTERLSAEAALKGKAQELRELDSELKEANKRVTNILAGILDGEHNRHRNEAD